MKDWQKTLVAPGDRIRSVIQLLNTTAMQIVLVVDTERRLLGTITDGDIRRGILSGVGLDAVVESIMNRSPKTARSGESRDQIVSRMTQFKVRHMPVLDETNRVVGLHPMEEYLEQRKKTNSVVLMAGGLGKRMSPLTDNCPKPMLKVGGKPILENIFTNFQKYGFNRFSIAVNYRAEMIEEYFGNGSNWGMEIDYIREPRQLGTGGALGLIEKRPVEPFFVMNGDVLSDVNFEQMLDFHLERKSKLTMAIREYSLDVPFGVIRLEQDRITGIDEKPSHKFFVNAGIYILDPMVLDWVPKDHFLDMPTLVESLIADHVETVAFPLREHWVDIGQKADFERANGEFGSVRE